MDYMEALALAVLGCDPGETDVSIPASVLNVYEQHGEDGLAAAWAYLCEGSDDITATLDNMKNYKGHFPDVGSFAKDFYTDQLDDATAQLPYGLYWSEHVDWDELGDGLAAGDLIYVIVVDSGVHVWDATT